MDGPGTYVFEDYEYTLDGEILQGKLIRYSDANGVEQMAEEYYGEARPNFTLAV